MFFYKIMFFHKIMFLHVIMIFAEAYFDKGIQGVISFSQSNNKNVRVDIMLKNVPIGIHGIHVHEKPIRNNLKKCCETLGPHFNGPNKIWSPKNLGQCMHGSYRLNTDRHIGDLCNNITSIDGYVEFSYIDDLISLVPEDEHCIVGRSIVIHENADDEGLYDIKNDSPEEIDKMINSRMTGNAGSRIACANIYYI